MVTCPLLAGKTWMCASAVGFEGRETAVRTFKSAKLAEVGCGGAKQGS